jgi:hypothetical protein
MKAKSTKITGTTFGSKRDMTPMGDTKKVAPLKHTTKSFPGHNTKSHTSRPKNKP